ncbi:MAG TPA: hypothetical protein VJH03_00245 [Blastocatellia bacterium]|nr:hypothetical protein [Blastocatellia bacterium]
MKSFPLIMAALFASLILTFLPNRASASDPVQMDPKHYRVNFENKKVRVLEFRLEPGGKVPMHSHPEHLIYALTSSTIKTTSADGGTVFLEFKAGEVSRHHANTYTGENTGTTESRVFIVEFKGSDQRGIELPNDADILEAARNERWAYRTSFQIAINTVLNNKFSYYVAFERDNRHYHLTPYVSLKGLPKNLRAEIAIRLSHPYDSKRNEFWFRIQFAARERPIKEENWRPAVTEEVKKAADSFINDTIKELLDAGGSRK